MSKSSYDALVQVERERLEALRHQAISRARDPLRADAELLGHLAWSRGLDYYGNWGLSVKRQVINQTPANLRIRGTRAAIENALAPFAADLKITEWWERTPEGQPGTGTAEIALGADIGTDSDVQSLILQVLRRESRKSFHWDLVVGVSGSAAIAAESRGRVTVLYQFSGVQAGA